MLSELLWSSSQIENPNSQFLSKPYTHHKPEISNHHNRAQFHLDYQVGYLVYLTITRHDISYAISLVSQFTTNPLLHLHLAAIKRILRYLLATPTRCLFYPVGFPKTLTAYSDVNWAGWPDSRRSTTGWCVYLGYSLISWKWKKQNKVSKSSIESEYYAMSSACLEILWLQGLLSDLGFP